MFNFKDFEVISYQPSALKTYEPSVTICDRKMIFGSVCFVRLGKPEYVRLMFDPKGKRIAVQGSNKKTKIVSILIPSANVNSLVFMVKDMFLKFASLCLIGKVNYATTLLVNTMKMKMFLFLI